MNGNPTSTTSSVNATTAPSTGPTFLDRQGNIMSDPTALPMPRSPRQMKKMQKYFKRLALANTLGVDVRQVGKHRGQDLITVPQYQAKKATTRAKRLRYKAARKAFFKAKGSRDIG